ncbi:MAG: type II toxin-antitoxin system Phd/YefM family antitoxin [Chloroflexi bacterium]|nr:type II toxin-antitoxin system Phd/YefM family antitoxin [Chloroflexota bacterium]
MKTVSLTEMKAHLSAYVKEAEESPVMLTRNGKPVAMLVSIEDQDNWDDALVESPQFQAILDKARQEFAEGKGIPHDEFWRQLDEEYGNTDQGGVPKHAKSK